MNSITSGVFDTPDACLNVFIFRGLYVNLTFPFQNDVWQIDFEGRKIKCRAILSPLLSQLVLLTSSALSRGICLHQTDT